MIHFSQSSISDKFQMYDYGSKQNLVHYNQSSAPLYDLKNVKVPVALYWALNDWLADPTDVKFLQTNLPNIIDDFSISDWNHLDFVWGIDTKVALYERIIQLFNNF